MLLASDGRCKVGDLGLAKFVSHTTRWILCGTPLYMAPEQLHGELSPALDVYALGKIWVKMVLLDEALEMMGPAFERQIDRAARKTDAQVRLLLRRCCDHDRARRPSAQMVVDILTVVQFAALGIPSPPEGGRECRICMDAPCATRFRPCHHSVACEACEACASDLEIGRAHV